MDAQSFVYALFGGLIAAGIKFVFDLFSVRLGWRREDDRARDKRISQVDQTARDTIARVERELNVKVDAQAQALARVQTQIENLPTAADIKEVRAAIARVDKEVAGCTAKIDGQSEMVRTIRDHILRTDR